MFPGKSAKDECGCPLDDRAAADAHASREGPITAADLAALSRVSNGDGLSDAEDPRLSALGRAGRPFGEAVLMRLGHTTLSVPRDRHIVTFVADLEVAIATDSATAAARRNTLVRGDTTRQNAHPMSTPPFRAAAAGFSLIELMVAIAIMLILSAVAAPSLRDFIMNVRLTGQANDLMTDLMLARSEATKRDLTVSVCPLASGSTPACATGADWKGGWMVVVDADSNGVKDTGTSPLRQAEPLSGSNSLNSSTTGAITFTPTGISATLASTTLTLCDPRGFGRSINVTPQGRAVVSKITGCTQS